ncbi:MAG: DUF4336 domain-containing protein [Myxococcales bacterium]|nr:DUF4336 domain-containing protein [Myxococcales bacterium]
MLEPIAPGLWHAHHDLYIPVRVHFRGRMVVARLSDGRSWVWSPIPIDDALAEEIDALGPVAHLVAPNAFHHLHFAAAAARYPKARRWIVPALAAKRPELEHDERLGSEPPADWSADFDQHLVEGIPKLDEVVFLHRPSRTLVITDLAFNILDYRGVMAGLVFRLVGTHKRFGQSRLLRSMVRDRAAAARSAQRILSWSFDRVVMAHGEIIEQDAHARMAQVLDWMLAGGVAQAS